MLKTSSNCLQPMELSLYVPRTPATQEERTHWDKNLQLVLDVVTGEDFPTGRTILNGIGLCNRCGLRRQPAKLRRQVRNRRSGGVAVQLQAKVAAAPLQNTTRKRISPREARLPSDGQSNCTCWSAFRQHVRF
jgi:hypothetical protein